MLAIQNLELRPNLLVIAGLIGLGTVIAIVGTLITKGICYGLAYTSFQNIVCTYPIRGLFNSYIFLFVGGMLIAGVILLADFLQRPKRRW